MAREAIAVAVGQEFVSRNGGRLESGQKKTRASIFAFTKAACRVSRVTFVSGRKTAVGIHEPLMVPGDSGFSETFGSGATLSRYSSRIQRFRSTNSSIRSS